MKTLVNQFKALGTHWILRALVVCGIILALVQVAFLGIQSQIAEKAETAGRSVINGSNASLNPYYFSQAISGLEMGNMLSCVEIRKAGQAIVFYESTPEYCDRSLSHRLLLKGEERVAVVKAANGEEWELKFRAVNGPLFSLALWAIRIASVLFILSLFGWAEWRVKTIRQLQEARLSASTELAHFSTQVAHDIRSPLAALNILVQTQSSNSDEEKGILKDVIFRINEIANSLLEKEKNLKKTGNEKSDALPLIVILDRLVRQKRIEFRAFKFLEISFKSEANKAVVTTGVSTSLSRAISNLINNSAEAIGNKPGRIIVKLSSNGINNTIFIIDTGPGMPADILEKLGERGVSFGKGESGSGLGVYQAKKAILEMNGKIEFFSNASGTQVKIDLPSPSQEICNVVLVDDDVALHQAWKLAARARNKSIRCFTNFSDLRTSLHLIPKAAEFYIDSHLTGEALRGEVLAKDLYQAGYMNISLCTGQPAQNFSKTPWIKTILGKEPPWL